VGLITARPVGYPYVWYKGRALFDEAEGKSGSPTFSEACDGCRETQKSRAEGIHHDRCSVMAGTQRLHQLGLHRLFPEARGQSRNWGKMMELELRRMVNLRSRPIAEGSLHFRSARRQERTPPAHENNPGAILQEQVLSTLWKGHPYEITVIGRDGEVAP